MSLANAIEAYEAALRPFGEIVSFEITPLDRTGVAVTSASLATDGRFVQHGNGYGTSSEAAMLSGLGELAEGVLAERRVSELRRESVRRSYRKLVAEEGMDRVADPRTLCLPAGSMYTTDLALDWVPLRRVRTGETVWAPVDFVASGPADLDGAPSLITPVSNGLGAGVDPARPVAHGILEILQRHTNGLRFRALDRLSPEIDQAGLPPRVRALVDDLRARGVDPVLKHAATAFGVCSTYVVGLDDDPASRIMLSGCGEAAHPDAETSLTKALLEFANSRVRKAFFFGSRDRAREVTPAGYWAMLEPATGEPRALEALRSWADLTTEQLRVLTAPNRSRTVSFSDIHPNDIPAGGLRATDLCGGDVRGGDLRGGDVRVGDVPAEPGRGSTDDDAATSQSALLAGLLESLAEHDVLTTTIEVHGVFAAKTLVPGLEVETLSYGRIGELGVRTALEADLDLVRIQSEPTASHPSRVMLTEDAEERLGGPAWYSYAAADRIVGDRYPLYREPPRHSVEV